MYKPVNVQLVYQCTSMYYYITSCTCVQACQRTISLPISTSMYYYITSCTCVQACQRTISLPMYKHVLLYNELYMCTSLSTYN